MHKKENNDFTDDFQTDSADTTLNYVHIFKIQFKTITTSKRSVHLFFSFLFNKT